MDAQGVDAKAVMAEADRELASWRPLAEVDPEIARVIAGELEREEGGLELIASENYTSRAVLETMGSLLTNKYAEGLPKARYYGGCEWVDEAEELARERAKRLFGAEHANVQPHAGAQANMAAYYALLEPGETLLGMDLGCGGHLTHGLRVNFSAVYYRAAHYLVDRETEVITADTLRSAAREAKPKLIVAGGSAYPRQIDFELFRDVADEVGAHLMVDMAHFAGLVAGGVHPSPVPLADIVTTTTHKTLRGPRAGLILSKRQHARAVDRAVFPGLQGGPLMHMIAAKAVCLHEAVQPAFGSYAQQVVENARAMADELLSLGFRLVSGGTDTHLMLADVTPLGIDGATAETALDRAGITLNKNAIPFDPRPPRKPSGVRIGTPAATTRGMGPDEMRRIARLIKRVLDAPEGEGIAALVRGEVRELCEQFPVYGLKSR